MHIRADGRKYRSKEEKRAIVERFEASGMTQEAFCEVEGIAKSSLCKWRHRYGDRKSGSGGRGFVEVLAGSEDVVRESAGLIELELPHGIILRIRS